MKNLLQEGDFVKCETLEDRELIINIALANGIDVKESVVKNKRNNSYPDLNFHMNRVTGYRWFHPDDDVNVLSQAEFIAKMLGVTTDNTSKKEELLKQIEVLQKQVEEL